MFMLAKRFLAKYKCVVVKMGDDLDGNASAKKIMSCVIVTLFWDRLVCCPCWKQCKACPHWPRVEMSLYVIL